MQLRLGTGLLLATIEPDSNWFGMFRVRLRSGRLTDMNGRGVRAGLDGRRRDFV